MGARYVWEKWNTVFSYMYRRASTSVSMEARGTYNVYEELDFNPNTGTFSLSGDYNTFNSYGYLYYSGNYYSVSGRYAESDFVNVYKLSARHYAERYISDAKKGSTSYGKVSANNYGAYPENTYNGDVWYVVLDPDFIDPDMVSYSGEIRPGETIKLTITPSSGNIHGGTITYTVQTTTNGKDYYDVGTTTDTTFSVTIPNDAVIWNVRVRAKDNMGYTSDTYIYGNGIDTWVTVVRSGMNPVSGDLGYITSKNLVAVSVSHVSDQTFSISATLDDEPCFSQTDLPISNAVMITLEDNVWNELSEENVHTLVVQASFTNLTEERTYTFKKFDYDNSSLEGVMDGIAKAVRIKRNYETQILGKNIPIEIAKIDNPVTSEDLAHTTAEESHVFEGYTFFSKDRTIKTGSALSEPANVTAQRMFTGTTAYNKQGKLITGAPTKTDVQASDIAAGKKAYTDAGALLTGTGLTVLAGSIQPTIEYRTYNIYYPSGVSGKPRAILAYFNVWIGDYATSGQQPSFSPYFFRGAVSGQLNGITSAVSGTMRNQNQSSANTTIDVYTSYFAVTFNKYDYVAENEFCYICIW